MIQDIVNGIAKALRNEFGAGYPIYQHQVRQGLRTPSFLVLLVAPLRTRQQARLWKQEHTFDVLYFPRDEDDGGALYGVMDRMLGCLELIPYGDGFLRGTGRSAQVQDGVVHVTVHYTAWLRELPEEANMEELEQRLGTEADP